MALSHGDRLATHWYLRPGWSDTARYLTFHLLVDGMPAVYRMVSRYHAALRGCDGVDLVPLPWLHLTVQGVGFVDQVAPREVAALVAAARAELSAVPSFTLHFAPPVVHRQGIVADAEPPQPVALLRAALRRAIAQVLGRDRLPGADEEPVWPHLSLGYAHASVPADPLLDALGALAPQVVTATFAHASLIELRREGRLYRWERLADLPFGELPVASAPR